MIAASLDCRIPQSLVKFLSNPLHWHRFLFVWTLIILPLVPRAAPETPFSDDFGMTWEYFLRRFLHFPACIWLAYRDCSVSYGWLNVTNPAPILRRLSSLAVLRPYFSSHVRNLAYHINPTSSGNGFTLVLGHLAEGKSHDSNRMYKLVHKYHCIVETCSHICLFLPLISRTFSILSSTVSKYHFNLSLVTTR